MNTLLTDAMLDVLVPSAPFEHIAGLLLERYAALADGICLRMPRDPSQDGAFARVVEALRTES
jgi:hypothetical protein